MNRRQTFRTLAALPLCSLSVPGRAAESFGAAVNALRADSKDARPEWVPERGMRRNISASVLADVDPCPSRNCEYSGVIGQRAVIDAWCGAAFATAYGRLGAWITTGGGHGDYYGNEVYAFELDTAKWRRLNDPFPGGPKSAIDHAEAEYAFGVPLSSHTYQHTQYLEPAYGGGPKGSLLLVVSYAAGRPALGSGRAHACDLATGRWTRYSGNKATLRVNATSATCVDAARHRIWRIPYGGAQIEYLDLHRRQFSVVATGAAGGNNFGVDHTCAHDPANDVIAVLDWPGKEPADLWLLDVAHPTGWSRASVRGDPPPASARGMALEWCPPLRCFVGYDGGGAAFVRKLVPPPADAMRAMWRWSTETLGGDAPAYRGRGAGMPYSRFRWAPSIASFLWVDGSRLPVQAWRLQGT